MMTKLEQIIDVSAIFSHNISGAFTMAFDAIDYVLIQTMVL